MYATLATLPQSVEQLANPILYGNVFGS